MKWQPIETAPKDGTEVILYTDYDGWLPYMYWDGDGWVSKMLRWSGRQPTHWLSEPKSPS